LQVCTIIAKNYVASARVLARSLAATNPDSRLWVLVIDDFDGYIDPAVEPFETLTPADIGCDPFLAMALRYSVLELSTAVKPWLLLSLLSRTGGPVTYLDPDIEIHGSLALLDAEASAHGLVLTPHNLVPIPADGRTPGQVDVMIAGIYNLGYVTVADRPEIDALLRWWCSRLEGDCRVDPVWGYFVDQRWFDLAPGFVSDLTILRDPGYNVAYWNLQDRELAVGADGYTVNGRPLAFFHYSGFDPAQPKILSRHQDRIDVTADPVLGRLLNRYAARLMAEGHDRARAWPYGYGALGDGTPVDAAVRILCADYAEEVDAETPSPFTAAGARRFKQWVAAQAPGAPAGVSRGLVAVSQRRGDLWSSYTSAAGIDGPGLLAWAREYGPSEEPVVSAIIADHARAGPPTEDSPAGDGFPTSRGPVARAELMATRDRAVTDGPPETVGPLRGDPFGVNVVGYFRSEHGVGEAARQIVGALDAADIDVLPIHGQTVPVTRQNHPYETAAPEDAPFPLNLICINADMLPEFAHQAGLDFFADRYSIGLWFWEVDTFPERWLESFTLLEEVWAPTAHVARALEAVATVPVTTVRIPLTPTAPSGRSGAELGLDPERFSFLFSFDYLSVAERKNALGLVAAFRRAFAGVDGVELVIKSTNREYNPVYHERLRASTAGTAVSLIDGYLSPEDNAALMAACDCYVSLHRAEGLGLGMAEAMWHGRPVIATGYSGNLDFMTADNALLVDYELVPIGAGFDPYPPAGHWAEPSLEHAAELMRRVVDDAALARALGRRAAADIRASHSPEAVGALLAERIELIRATGRVRPRRWPRPPASQRLAGLPVYLRSGPVLSARGRLRHALRGATLRAMRPYTSYQQDINLHMVGAIHEVSDAVGQARRETALDLSRVLRELRRTTELRSLQHRLEEQARRIAELERKLGS
jgi:glycosyltransferase involved in cell wall biosynthesis